VKSHAEGLRVKTDWKILPVLLPGALLGVGAGALVAAFQFDWAVSVASPLQTAGIVVMVGSIVLRILLSQAGLSLADYGGLLFNGVCVFLSGIATIAAVAFVLRDGKADLLQLGSALTLAWIPCLLLTAVGATCFAALRRNQAAAGKD
jgi:hypothetical protein